MLSYIVSYIIRDYDELNKTRSDTYYMIFKYTTYINKLHVKITWFAYDVRGHRQINYKLRVKA